MRHYMSRRYHTRPFMNPQHLALIAIRRARLCTASPLLSMRPIRRRYGLLERNVRISMVLSKRPYSSKPRWMRFLLSSDCNLATRRTAVTVPSLSDAETALPSLVTISAKSLLSQPSKTVLSVVRYRSCSKASALSEAGSRVNQLAFHFALSPDQAKGIEYSQRAAAQALQNFAAEEAMIHYPTALDLLGSQERPRGDLLLGLGGASLLAGKEAEAVKSYAAAYHALSHGGDLNAAAQAAHGLGRAHWPRGCATSYS